MEKDIDQAQKGKVVYSYYVLDIVHPGHLITMRNAKAVAGENGTSVVAILTDEAVLEKKKKPALPFAERIELAKAIRYADVIVAQPTYSPIENIKKIRPDVLMESDSHDPVAIEQCREVMKEMGGEVLVLPYYPEQSSTNIKNSIKNS